MAGMYACVVLLQLIVGAWCVRENNQQNGTTNFQGKVDDFVVAVFYDESDGDTQDYYDYSDLTVKPEQDLVPPSPPMTSSTESAPTSEPTLSSTTSAGSADKVPVTEQNVTSTPVKNEELTASASEPKPPLNTQDMLIPVVVLQELKKKGYISSSSIRKKNAGTPEIDVESLPKRTCSPGFVLDEKNRCKRNKKPAAKHRPPLPYGLHYAKSPQDVQPEVIAA